jgi:hypothetical protein
MLSRPNYFAFRFSAGHHYYPLRLFRMGWGKLNAGLCVWIDFPVNTEATSLLETLSLPGCAAFHKPIITTQDERTISKTLIRIGLDYASAT